MACPSLRQCDTAAAAAAAAVVFAGLFEARMIVKAAAGVPLAPLPRRSAVYCAYTLFWSRYRTVIKAARLDATLTNVLQPVSCVGIRILFLLEAVDVSDGGEGVPSNGRHGELGRSWSIRY